MKAGFAQTDRTPQSAVSRKRIAMTPVKFSWRFAATHSVALSHGGVPKKHGVFGRSDDRVHLKGRP